MICEVIETEKELVPLTDKEEELVNQLLYKGLRSEVLCTKFNIDMTRDKISCLRDRQWLNDEVINYYMNMILERSQNSTMYPKCYVQNTFFYHKLVQQKGYDYNNVKRWTRKV